QAAARQGDDDRVVATEQDIDKDDLEDDAPMERGEQLWHRRVRLARGLQRGRQQSRGEVLGNGPTRPFYKSRRADRPMPAMRAGTMPATGRHCQSSRNCMLYSDAYRPPAARSWSCGPCSTILPAS